MAERASALLALWNDVDPALDDAYNDWHAREHVPERLTVPGMLWAQRYARADDSAWPRYLTLYGLRDAAVLDSAAYRQLLAEPTPASRAMRPALRNLSRWVCRLDEQIEIDRFDDIDVRTVTLDVALPDRRPGEALLVATRLPEAAVLPWLSGGQSRPIEGDRLRISVCDPAAACGTAGAVRYRRLPVG